VAAYSGYILKHRATEMQMFTAGSLYTGYTGIAC